MPVIQSNAELRVNQQVWVRAWWTKPEGEVVRCRVLSLGKASDQFITVEPLDGYNHHSRFIDIKTIASCDQ